MLLLRGCVDIVFAHEFELPVVADAEHADGAGSVVMSVPSRIANGQTDAVTRIRRLDRSEVRR